MPHQTVTALFDSRSEATKTVAELVKAGIDRASIRMTPETDVAATTTTDASYDSARDEKGFWASLGEMFMPDDDRHTYAEAMNRGGILLSVTTDETHAARVEDILEMHGTVDIDEREASYRRDGWTGTAGASTATAGASTATGLAMTGGVAAGTTGAVAAAAGNEVVSLVEERLNVGKRQVSAGRVKVRSYVVETPVSEQVNLHSETVHVDRRVVDRALAPGEDPFEERSFEATSTAEEAVVSKTARVTGEVHLTKTAEDRVETVSDKVRSTKVDVEDDRALAQAATTTTTGLPPRRV